MDVLNSVDTTEIVNNLLASLMPLFIALLVTGLIATIIAIAYWIRVWSVQTATLKMQKDVAEIKNHLEKLNSSSNSNSNDTIAQQ